MAYTQRYSSRSGQNRLSDHDMLLDLLCTEKSMSHMYDHAITEATNNTILNTFEQLQHDEHENAHMIFDTMQERGWYNTTKVPQKRSSRYVRGVADSNYTVTSGAQQFGSKLKNSGSQYESSRSSKRTNNSSYGSQLETPEYHDWQ
ncbi:MAG TPA: spore coat protein [Negativicutes bacterium]